MLAASCRRGVSASWSRCVTSGRRCPPSTYAKVTDAGLVQSDETGLRRLPHSDQLRTHRPTAMRVQVSVTLPPPPARDRVCLPHFCFWCSRGRPASLRFGDDPITRAGDAGVSLCHERICELVGRAVTVATEPSPAPPQPGLSVSHRPAQQRLPTGLVAAADDRQEMRQLTGIHMGEARPTTSTPSD